MGEVLPLPNLGDVFADVRDEDRTMRVSCHADRGVVVVSLWAGPVCRGSFRMAATDVDRLVSALTGMGAAARSGEVAAPAAGSGPTADPTADPTESLTAAPTAADPAAAADAAADERPGAAHTGRPLVPPVLRVA